MEDIDHPELIEEQKQNIEAADHEKNINQDVNLPSIKKKLIVMIKLKIGPKA